ncbi:MAG: hypothetical protein KIS81_06470 [Maricaulaceae bacterium]|nr:hypothetical protein [Maricaulaceae bacterium]
MGVLTVLPALFALASAAQDSAFEAAERARYAACLEQVETDPVSAYEDALTWKFEGGGWLPRHCEARALVRLGYNRDGAARLEAVAAAPDGGPRAARVLQYAEAGEAWMAAREPAGALRAYGHALDLSPESAPLWLGRARAAAAMDEWSVALSAAAAAAGIDPEEPEAWRRSAEAKLMLGDYDGAETDMNRARELDPADVETLLIRGRILEARRTGRRAAPDNVVVIDE